MLSGKSFRHLSEPKHLNRMQMHSFNLVVFLIPFTLTRYDAFMTEENWKTPPGLSFSGITMVVWVEPTFNLWVSEGETEVKVIVISSSNSGVSSGIMVMISRDSELPDKKFKVKFLKSKYYSCYNLQCIQRKTLNQKHFILCWSIHSPASIVTVPEEIPVSEAVTMAALTPEPFSVQSISALPLVPSLVSFSATFYNNPNVNHTNVED